MQRPLLEENQKERPWRDHSDTLSPRRSRMGGSVLTSVDGLLDDNSYLPPEHRAQELDD